MPQTRPQTHDELLVQRWGSNKMRTQTHDELVLILVRRRGSDEMRTRSSCPKLYDKAMQRTWNCLRMRSGFPKLDYLDESEERNGCQKLDHKGQWVGPGRHTKLQCVIMLRTRNRTRVQLMEGEWVQQWWRSLDNKAWGIASYGSLEV